MGKVILILISLALLVKKKNKYGWGKGIETEQKDFIHRRNEGLGEAARASPTFSNIFPGGFSLFQKSLEAFKGIIGFH